MRAATRHKRHGRHDIFPRVAKFRPAQIVSAPPPRIRSLGTRTQQEKNSMRTLASASSHSPARVWTRAVWRRQLSRITRRKISAPGGVRVFSRTEKPEASLELGWALRCRRIRSWSCATCFRAHPTEHLESHGSRLAAQRERRHGAQRGAGKRGLWLPPQAHGSVRRGVESSPTVRRSGAYRV